ncbi:type IIL restriction-modification enzyme MmeI [Corynebacterium aurimucosum]|uniref:type IIL restriction-modification enzyme MmeI n=1 Tax=Corynebacterium aurimucosum TaxID=169292 RepID=UPI003084671A
MPLIPLKETGQIHAGNATRIDWNEVCPNNGTDEIYLIGNPPYKGGKSQPAELKADYPYVFGERKYSKDLDYIALWFVKGADYISGTDAELAFVSTNSVVQGEHVGLMFPYFTTAGVEIGFGHSSFKWANNARQNAGVTVIVLGMRRVQKKSKFLFTDGIRKQVSNLNGYLSDAPDVFVRRRTTPITTWLPRMTLGSMPKDGGHLILEADERQKLLANDHASRRWIKRYTGAADFINDTERFCFWIPDSDVEQARLNKLIAQHLDAVSNWRLKSSAQSTRDYAQFPNRFKQMAYKNTDSIIVPRVSAERRQYIPIGYLGPETVIADSANAVYDAKPWLFGLLTSKMHIAWAGAVGGKLKTDYRYGAYLVYNNFPVPELSDPQKQRLTELALRVLDVREYHCDKTLAQLYDPDLMPENLRQAHHEIDMYVDSLYSKRAYETDEERLSDLFAMYEDMVAAEEAAKPKKKTRKQKK